MRTGLPQRIGDETFDHVRVSPDGDAAASVLVFHGMEGRSDAQLAIAHRLTEWGFNAVAVDLFGEAVTRGGPQRCAAEMESFVTDRTALAERLAAVVGELTAAPQITGGPVAAIGFCFGGLCVLDVARAGLGVAAVASFHGLLTAPEGSSGDISAKVAVYHGWDDPFAPPEHVVALGRELTARRADWRLHAYGHAMHAFMAPFADQPERGIQYDAVTADRAWRALGEFLAETFQR